MGDSRQSVVALQTQLEDYRERSRKDLLEAQRNCKDRLAELQRSQNNLKAPAGRGEDMKEHRNTKEPLKLSKCFMIEM